METGILNSGVSSVPEKLEKVFILKVRESDAWFVENRGMCVMDTASGIPGA
jgi:hypothetical protein